MVRSSKAKEVMRKKFKECDVHHVVSGKSHLFFITSPSGSKYNVALTIGCDCKFMQKYSVNGKLCSHCLAVIDRINEGVGFDDFRN